MKKLLLLSIVNLAVTLHSQPVFNRAFHDYQSYNYAPVTLDGNYYFARYGSVNGGVNPTEIVSYDATGKTRFIYSSTKFSLGTITDFQATSDHGLIYAGYETGCDFTLPNAPVFVTKLDSSGTPVFEVKIAELENYGGNVKVTESPGGDYFIVYNDTLYRLSSNGALLSSKAIQNWSNHKDIVSWGANRFLVGGDLNNQRVHAVIDSTGTMSSYVAADNFVYEEEFFPLSDGRIVNFYSSTGIRVLDTNLSVQASFSLVSGISDVSVVNDTIYAITSEHLYLVKNASLNYIYTYSLSAPSRVANGIALNGSKVAITSNGSSTYNQPEALTVFPKLNTNSYSKDVGVVKADYVAATGKGYVYSGPGVVIMSTVVPKSIVKNFGTDTVKSFVLNCLQYYPSICGSRRYLQRFDGLLIPPGGTVEVTGNAFELYNEIHGATSVPYSFSLGKIKFYTTAPDDEVDGNISNDLDSVVINVVTSLREQVNSASSSIFPNPAINAFEWKSSEYVNHISVRSVDGRKISSLKEFGFNGLVNISDFSPGIYFIEFESENGTSIQKLVKE